MNLKSTRIILASRPASWTSDLWLFFRVLWLFLHIRTVILTLISIYIFKMHLRLLFLWKRLTSVPIARLSHLFFKIFRALVSCCFSFALRLIISGTISVIGCLTGIVLLFIINIVLREWLRIWCCLIVGNKVID